MKLKFVVLNDNNFSPKMFKPPDNPNIGSEDNQRYFQYDTTQKSWYEDEQRQQVYSCYKNRGSYQQNQRKHIYQNNKTYFYRTCKWLQFYRIAYPDPYSGPGPGPGCCKCQGKSSSRAHSSASPSVVVVETAQEALPTQTVDEPLVIIAPSSPLTFDRLWATLSPHSTRVSSVKQSNQKHQKYQNPLQHCQQRQRKYQKHRQHRMFGRNFLWLLIILIFFDSGPLDAHGKLVASTLSVNDTMTAAPGNRQYNKERDNYNNNIRTTSKFGMGSNNNINYTKFLNANAYNNRNDIMKGSNTYTNINSKHSFNDYKNLFLNYNDISSNNNDIYNTNQYSSMENNKFTNSNRKFSYIKNNNTSTNTDTHKNNMSHNNNANAYKMVHSTSSSQTISQRSSSEKDIINSVRNTRFHPDNKRVNIDVHNEYAATPNNVFNWDRPSVTSLIAQQKNSMKASLHVIRNFKLDEANVRSSTVRSKSRPAKQKLSKNMPSSVKNSNEDTNHYDTLRKQFTKKNKRTTDNNSVKLRPTHPLKNRAEDASSVGELQNRLQQQYERQNHGSFQQKFHDQQFLQGERNRHHQRRYTNELVKSEQMQKLQDHQKQPSAYHYDPYFQQLPHQDHQHKDHQHFDAATLPIDENSPASLNYKRSLLASISCPNCVYNLDSYLTAEIFAPSLLSASPILSSSPLTSSNPDLKRFQNGNQPIQSHQQHPEQYTPYPHNSLQYSTINNNNNEDNFNNYDNNPKQYYNNKKLNNIYNRNTINANSNSFHQPFHQFDSDQIRLESIKHQILSKLGLKTKPNVTQTLPKQFIMETIYRAESSGRRGLKSKPTQYSDSSARSMMSNSFGESEFKHDSSSTNDFFYSDYSVNSNKGHNNQNVKAKIVSLSSPLSPELSQGSAPFSPYMLTRRTGELVGSTDSVGIRETSVDSDEHMLETNSESFGGYLHQSQDGNIFSSSLATVSSPGSPVDMSTHSSPPSASSTASPTTEQDDFYGRTKEIITFAEKGGILNGHRLVEFSSLSDQMTGQNLRIRTAFMWIRVDLRPTGDLKRHRKPTTARLKLLPSILKVWVFRLVEPYATSLNTTEFVRKDFDQITALSTTLNVQFNQLGWQKLDITETVQRWYAKDRHMRLRLLVDCSGCGDLVTLHLFGNEPPKSSDNPSTAKMNTRPHNHDRSHHRHQHQRHRLPHARKPGQQSSQKYPNVPNDKQRHRMSTNRTSSASFRKQAHIALFLDEDQNQSLSGHVYKNQSRSKVTPTLRHRSNEITKPNDVQDQTTAIHEEESSNEVDPNRPFLVIHTEPNVMKRVRRRALDCSGALNGQCCKESFYVSFKALGWDDWIIAPHGYFANYCRGDCAGPRTPDTYQSYHTHVMEEFRKLDRLTGMQPCCAPLKFSSMSLIYYGKEGIIKRDLPKMVVDECGCP